MASLFNIIGTTQNEFKIGKNGPKIIRYQNATDAILLPDKIYTSNIYFNQNPETYINSENYTGTSAISKKLENEISIVSGDSNIELSSIGTDGKSNNSHITLQLTSINSSLLTGNIAYDRLSSLIGTTENTIAAGDHNHDNTYIAYGKTIVLSDSSDLKFNNSQTEYTITKDDPITLDLKLKDNSVTESIILNGSVTTNKIADNSISVTKLQEGDYSSKITLVQKANSASSSDTAKKLSASVSLWGQSFDGSESISGSIQNTNQISPSASGQYDIGTTNLKYRNLYLSGDVVANILNILSNATIGGDLDVSGELTSASLSSDGNLVINGTSTLKAISGTSLTLTGSVTATGLTINGSSVFTGDITASGRTVTANTFKGNLSGSATSAYTLVNPRSLWGNSFDGSKDISGSIDLSGNNINNVSQIIPPNGVDNTSIGESGNGFHDIYATTFHGSLSGNASSATTATKISNSLTVNGLISGQKTFNGQTAVAIDVSANNISGLEDYINSNTPKEYKGEIVFSSTEKTKYTPAATKGDYYVISIPSDVSGCTLNGITVYDKSLIICNTESTEAGTADNAETISDNWNYIIIPHNAVSSSVSTSNDGDLVIFDGTSGKLVKSLAANTYVKTSGDETINGQKTFNDVLTVNNDINNLPHNIFTSRISGEKDPGNFYDYHSIVFSAEDSHTDFNEIGADWRFYKTTGVTSSISLIAQIKSEGIFHNGEKLAKESELSKYLPLTGGTLTGDIFSSGSQLSIVNGSLYYNGSAVTTTGGVLASNGIAFTNPTAKTDCGWMRVLGTAESSNDTILELATGDDGGVGETIHFRGYRYGAINYDVIVPKKNGTIIVDSDAATSSSLGLIKLGFTTDNSQRNYAVQLSNQQAYVNVPWTDNNTTYTFTNGNGSFTVKSSDGSTTNVSIGKPSTAGTADIALVANKLNNKLSFHYNDELLKEFDGSSAVDFDFSEIFKDLNSVKYKGTIDFTSTDKTKYTPAGNSGDMYFISTDPASLTGCTINGVNVFNGDIIICNTDDTIQADADNQSSIINNWNIIKSNNINEDNLVHLTGNETISGDKTFTGKVITSKLYSNDGSSSLTLPTSSGTLSRLEDLKNIVVNGTSYNLFNTQLTLANVAATGSYNDLLNKPDIPTAVTIGSQNADVTKFIYNIGSSGFTLTPSFGFIKSISYNTSANSLPSNNSEEIAATADGSIVLNKIAKTGITLSESGTGNVVSSVSVDSTDKSKLNVSKITALTTHQSIKNLDTTRTTSQNATTEAISGSGTIYLHKVAKTGNYNDLSNTPTIPTIPNISVNDSGSGDFISDVTASGHTITLTRKDVGEATTAKYGGVKLAGSKRSSAITTIQGGTTSNRYYGLEIDSTGKAFVNVPWVSYDLSNYMTLNTAQTVQSGATKRFLGSISFGADGSDTTLSEVTKTVATVSKSVLNFDNISYFSNGLAAIGSGSSQQGIYTNYISGMNSSGSNSNLILNYDGSNASSVDSARQVIIGANTVGSDYSSNLERRIAAPTSRTYQYGVVRGDSLRQILNHDLNSAAQWITQTQLSSVDLNNYYGEDKLGFYFLGGNHNCQNTPENHTEGLSLVVYRTALSYYAQLAILASANSDIRNGSQYIRTYNGSSWSSWRKIFSSTGLTSDRVLVSDDDNNIVASGISTTKLNYLSDVTGNIQSQINSLSSSVSNCVTTNTTQTNLSGDKTWVGAHTFENDVHIKNNLYNAIIDLHPENTEAALLSYLGNDLQSLTKRGGVCEITGLSTTPDQDAIDNLFDGSPSYSYFNVNNSTDTVIIKIISPVRFTFTAKVGIGFGNGAWRAGNVKIERAYTPSSTFPADDQYTTICDITNNYENIISEQISTGAESWNCLKITLSNFPGTAFRIGGIWAFDYHSSGLAESYLNRDGSSMYGPLISSTSQATLGTSSSKWPNIYATTANLDSANIANSSFTKVTGNVLGASKNLTKITTQLFASNGIVFGGSAQDAGLVTRGICGVLTPDSNGGCTKSNLFVNFDGTNTYNSSRQIIIQASDIGTHYGNNLYQYCAARGDAVHDYLVSNYLPLSGGTLTGYSETAVDWVLNLKNTYNANTTARYGIGLKLSNGNASEGNKWAGIASTAGSSYSNATLLSLYAQEGERLTLSKSAFYPTTNGAITLGSSSNAFGGVYIANGHNLNISAGKLPVTYEYVGLLASDGVAFRSPGTANDSGWFRVLGTGESDTVVEVAAGDDSGTGETIQFNYYNTNNEKEHSVSVPKKSGTIALANDSSQSGYLALSGGAMNHGSYILWPRMTDSNTVGIGIDTDTNQDCLLLRSYSPTGELQLNLINNNSEWVHCFFNKSKSWPLGKSRNIASEEWTEGTFTQKDGSDAEYLEVECSDENEITGVSNHTFDKTIPDISTCYIKKIQGQTRRKSLNLINPPQTSWNVGGLNLTYDPSTGIFTLNGTVTTANAGATITSFIPITDYSINLEHLSGSISGSGDELRLLFTYNYTNNILAVTNNDPFASCNYSGIAHPGETYKLQLMNNLTQTGGVFTKYKFRVNLVEGIYSNAASMPPFKIFDDTLVNSKANIISTGKNILKPLKGYRETIDGITCIIQEDGRIHLNGTATVATGFNIFEPVYILQNYSYRVDVLTGTTSSVIYFTNKVGNFQSSTKTNKNISVSHPDIPFSGIYIASGTVIKDLMFKITLVYGDVSLNEFIPYNENELSLGIELGEYDYIDTESKTLVRQTSDVLTFDGSDDESWEYGDDYFTFNGIESYGFNEGMKFVSNTWNTNNRFNWEFGNITRCDTRLLFSRQGSTITSVESWREYLKENPISIVFEKSSATSESFDVKSVYPVCYGGLETQETDTIPYVLTKRYALNISSNVKNLSDGIGSVKGVNATNSDSKLYLMGSTAQTAGPDTYSNSEIYAMNGTLTTTKTQIGGGKVTMEYNSEDDCLDFVF